MKNKEESLDWLSQYKRLSLKLRDSLLKLKKLNAAEFDIGVVRAIHAFLERDFAFSEIEMRHVTEFASRIIQEAKS